MIDLNNYQLPEALFFPFPHQVAYVSKNMDQIDDLSPDELISAKKAIKLREESWKLIQSDQNPDQYLMTYPPKSSKFQLLNNLTDAKQKLFSFNQGFFGETIQAFEKAKIDIFIGGSSSLLAVSKNSTHVPSDIDMYMKNINLEQLQQIEQVIYSLKKPNQRIVVVRRPITIAWWFINPDDQIVNQIQVNALQNNHWIKIFEDYHANLVCIGYHVLSGDFLYHSIRWTEFINNDSINWFSNIYSSDVMFTLIHATNKYLKRGFNVKALLRDDTNKCGFTVGRLDTFDDLASEAPHVVDRLISFKWDRNVIISDHIKNIFDQDEHPAPIDELFHIMKKHPEYYFRCKKLNYQKPKDSPYQVVIQSCKHEVLLEDIISFNSKTKFPVCPVCNYRFIDVKLKKIDD